MGVRPVSLYSSTRHDMLSLYQSCALCEHRCLVNRQAGERGTCKADASVRVFRHRIEYGEEPELLPCHLFYTSGCDLRCAFCIAEENAFDPSRGTLLTPSFLNDAIQWGIGQGARTLQWVGGEPTIHAPGILECMKSVDQLPPVVWKSDFYMTPETIALLEPWVSWFVADFKFGNNACAEQIASVPNYFEIVTRNLLLASQSSDLIIRHLLLPGHFECCVEPITSWLREHLPEARINLLSGYLPKWRAQRDETLNRMVTRSEFARAKNHLLSAGLALVH